MKRTIAITIAILATFIQVLAQNTTDTSGNAEFYHKFAFRSFSNENITLPYREASICQNESEQSALVIFLHGGSHRGDDNKSQIRSTAIRAIVNYLENSNIKSIVVAPQCDKNHFWHDYDGKVSTALKQLIDKLIADNSNINSSRIYIFGYSSGGAGVWRMISDYPDTFAAAMAVASYPRNAYPKNIAQTALCCIMAGKDDKAKVSLVKPTIKETQKYGGTIKFIVEKDCDHISVCPVAFSDTNLKWVFNKRK